MQNVLDIPGARRFCGAGVYVGVPDRLPDSLRGQHAVIVADAPAAAPVVMRLHECGCHVTVLTPSSGADVRALRRAVRGRANIAIWPDAELACVEGIAYVEAVVIRRCGCRKVDVRNAAAVFVLDSSRT